MKHQSRLCHSKSHFQKRAATLQYLLMKAVKNVPLIAGISIPLAMILFVAASIYLPGIFVQPKYGFLYLNGDTSQYSCQWRYEVEGQHLVPRANLPPLNQNYRQQYCSVTLWVYDVRNNTNRQVSLEEAQRFTLDNSPTSPDGFEITRGSGGGSFLFFFDVGSRDYNATYLRGHNVSRNIDLHKEGESSSYYNRFKFLGWIL